LCFIGLLKLKKIQSTARALICAGIHFLLWEGEKILKHNTIADCRRLHLGRISNFLILLIAIASFAALAERDSKEVASVRARISADRYSMPLATITQLERIERELTPAASEHSSELVDMKTYLLCDVATMEIFYKVEESSARESFLATFVMPKSREPFPVKYPAVVIQPTLAGPGLLEEAIAFNLCMNGFASIVPNETLLNLPAKLPDFQVYDRNNRIEMIRARRMVDVLMRDGKVDSKNVGAIGFSRGAIAGALLIGIESRIKFAFLGAGGTGLGHIIARSRTEKGIKDNQEQMAAAGMDNDQFERILIKNIRYDAILFSQRFDPSSLKIMIVHNDESVDVKNQEMLRKDFGNPSTIYRSNGHVGSILDIVFAEQGKEYIEFFKTMVGRK
jgi:hypothetical protein